MKIYSYNGRRNLIGERVYQTRSKMDLSQADVAARLQLRGVLLEQKAISRIELGERFVADYELLYLADVLKVSVLWLLTGRE